MEGSLDDALRWAGLVVTMNSNTGVDAVMAGVPGVVCDVGSMAWPVSSIGLGADPVRPDREDWFAAMAWRQWTLEELASGSAWEHVQQGRNAPEAPFYASGQPIHAPRPGKRALVLGGGASLWQDVDAALAISEFDGVVACNDAGANWRGDLDAFVTLHPDKLTGWLGQRQALGLSDPRHVIAHRQVGGAVTRVLDYRWPEMQKSGSSGLFAVKAALDLGFDRLVLCGIPIEPSGHFFDPKEWSDASLFKGAWVSVRDRLSGNVRSMSGWTRQLFGQPTVTWLAGATS